MHSLWVSHTFYWQLDVTIALQMHLNQAAFIQ